MNYKPVIGLEVHVELKTASKMFCRCSTHYFGQKPNTHTCPVCLGLPGALPYPNKLAIEWCIKIAKALGCEINKVSKFDRKNYFYPDLAKGYQISQYDQPFGENGTITVTRDKDSEEIKKIGITRVHMEEDTGKLTHAEGASLIDFNRSGVPLVEIVTEPDFENAHQVAEYLKKLQQIMRYLEVSNADMEKGEMRLEPNISLQKNGESGLPKYKVEVKNINSFKFVTHAINFEINRQEKILESEQVPTQETRGWNETKSATVSQRSKEDAHDYRYFPEPDIPPIVFSKEEIDKITLPELPDEKIQRFQKEYGLSLYDCELLTKTPATSDYFEEASKVGSSHNLTPKQIANYLINKKLDIDKILPAEVIEEILVTLQTVNITDEQMSDAIKKVFEENLGVVEDYKSGKTQVMGFLIGNVKRLLPSNIDVSVVKKALENQLQSS